MMFYYEVLVYMCKLDCHLGLANFVRVMDQNYCGRNFSKTYTMMSNRLPITSEFEYITFSLLIVASSLAIFYY